MRMYVCMYNQTKKTNVARYIATALMSVVRLFLYATIIPYVIRCISTFMHYACAFEHMQACVCTYVFTHICVLILCTYVYILFA